MTNVRSSFLALLGFGLLVCTPGCASTTTLPVPVVALSHPAVKSQDDRDVPIAVKRTGDKPYDFVLVQNDHAIDEARFRGLYRDVVHTNELDALVKKRAKHMTLVAVAMGSGMTVLGAGGLALAGLPSSDCGKNPRCGDGVVSAALIGAYGLYILGCVAVEGPRCMIGGHVLMQGVGLTREEAERYVTKYDEALAVKL